MSAAGESAALLLSQQTSSTALAAASAITTSAANSASMFMHHLQQQQQQGYRNGPSMIVDEFFLRQAAAAVVAQQQAQQQNLLDSSDSSNRHSPYSIDQLIRNEEQQLQRPVSSNEIKSLKKESISLSTVDEETSNICCVCNDEASGRHYGAFTCFGCKGFFRRTVRANKVYTCRYEERCQIDKVGRNICRSCRFRKCLEVGMEPDAIRPDRDKTGRQKNPRRSANSMSSNRSVHGDSQIGDQEDDRHKATSSPALGDGQCGSSASSQSGSAEFSLRSHCETMAPSSAALAQRDLIMDTLAQIERICTELSDDLKTSTASDDHVVPCLSDVITQTRLIAPRTSLDYSGNSALKTPDEYIEGIRRLVVMAIDYANTLKPIADMDASEKIILLRSFIASFVILSTSFRSVSEGRPEAILLPNGYFVDTCTPISVFREQLSESAREHSWLEARINFIRSNILDKLNIAIEKLDVSEQEYFCLKAIIALDPNASQISDQTSQTLSLARDSVQNALYLHLSERYNSTEAIARFGRLLMLVANVTKTGAFLSSLMQMGRDIKSEHSLFLDLFAV